MDGQIDGLDQIRLDQIRLDRQIRQIDSQIRLNLIRLDQIRIDQIRLDQITLDQTRFRLDQDRQIDSQIDRQCTHTHSHTHIYIYVYTFTCTYMHMYTCLSFCLLSPFLSRAHTHTCSYLFVGARYGSKTWIQQSVARSSGLTLCTDYKMRVLKKKLIFLGGTLEQLECGSSFRRSLILEYFWMPLPFERFILQPASGVWGCHSVCWYGVPTWAATKSNHNLFPQMSTGIVELG